MTGTQIAYYFLCHRKLWLFMRNIDMEQTSDTVAMGKFISESTYEREKHEVQISDEDDQVVLDFYDDKTKTIHEVKKSDKMEDTHIWQVKFYIYVLEKKGMTGVIRALLTKRFIQHTRRIVLSGYSLYLRTNFFNLFLILPG